MSDAEKTGGLWGRGIASAPLCRSVLVAAAAGPASLPTRDSVAVEVDITGLPASEQAALVPLVRAAR